MTVEKFTTAPKNDELVNKVNEIIDNLGGSSIIIDQTFDGTSTNAQSGVAISGELGNFVQKEDVSAWTPSVKDTNLGNYNGWCALAYDGTKFVVLGYDGYISTSTDGITWTSVIQNTELGENYWNDLVYNGISFIALGLHGYISTSTDGITWTTAVQNTNLGDNTWESLTYDGTKIVALGRKGYISTSTDGITWTEAIQSVELGKRVWEYLAYDGTKFVALEQNGYTSTSTDGITWTTAVKNTNLGSHTWRALAYDGTKFVALEQNGYTSTSTDGITWATAVRDTNLGSSGWRALTYGGTKFVALAQSGYVSTSSGLTHLLNIQNNLYIDFTNNNKFNLLDGSTGLIPDERLSTNIARTSSIGNGTITFTQGGVTKGTITTNQSGDTTIDFDTGGSTITVDSALSTSSTNPVQNKVITVELNKKIESITLSDVTTALGYTPYNGATNPNGYITSSALSNYVDLTSAQDISGRKTFLGEKAIYFKQLTTANKLGFTLYNPSNTELGALEYRPSTIGSASLLALNCPQTTGGYVGFRYWGTPAVNIVAPKVATAGNYFIPTHITDGNTTVTANNTGTVNISTLLPDVSNFVTNTSLATTLQDYVLSSDLSTTLTNYVTSSSLTTVLNDYQPLLVSGINIKTVNNQSILGSGNIDIQSGVSMTYDSTTETLTFA